MTTLRGRVDQALNSGSDSQTSPASAAADPLALLDDYDFELPATSIAQEPAATRDAARLLVLDRRSGEVVEASEPHRVSALPDWLREGDLLVVNVTRVLPARLTGQKSTGGAAEALLLGPGAAPGQFRALVKCRGRLRVGLEFEFGASEPLHASIHSLYERGEIVLQFAADADPYREGHAPLPPYIRRDPKSTEAQDSEVDRARYQTVYAREPGAVAAPTAGLHLTDALLTQLRAGGVEVAEVVLHVGAGTFRPLEAEAFQTGRLHPERFVLPPETARAIDRTRARGGRVIAVGTTTARVLESQAEDSGGVRAGDGETDLFLYPGAAPFRVVDGLLTNFHLPRSSLLLLVAAFVGRETMLATYARAVADGFRFYSFGDAMLILPNASRRANV